MKLTTSTLRVSLRGLVFPVLGSTLLLLCPSNLLAQAAGSNPTPAGTPSGQDPAAAGQNPQHRRHTPQEIEEALRRVRRNAKKSPKIRNTHNADDPQTAAIRAALEQLKAGRHTPGATGGSGQSGNGGGASQAGSSPTSANPAGATGGSTGSTTGSSTPPAGTPGVPPGNTPGARGSTPRSVSVASMAVARPALVAAPATPPPPPPPSSRLATAPQPSLASTVACSTKTLLIQNINGVKTGMSNPNIVFTQDPQYNDYRISGCNFGNTQGQAHLNGPFRAGVIPLQIKSWTDTSIELMLDPNLKGEPDQNSVTLVINPVGAAQAQLQNCKFYALRQEITLASLPQNHVNLGAIVDDSGIPVSRVKYSSPYSGLGASTAPGTGPFTGGVDRTNSNRFPAGTDVWDLSALAPGFVPTQFSLTHWALESCVNTGFFIGDTTVYTDGQWSAQWDPANPKHLIVNVAEEHCHETDGTDDSSSSYALEIQVNGPVGVNPLP